MPVIRPSSDWRDIYNEFQRKFIEAMQNLIY